MADAKVAVTDTHKNGVKDKADKADRTDKTRRRAKIVITDLLEPGAVQPKYEFEMELELRETGRGR